VFSGCDNGLKSWFYWNENHKVFEQFYTI